MIRAFFDKSALRRSLALTLVVAGAVVMFLAPETWAGLALLVVGVALEVAAAALRHRDSAERWTSHPHR